MASPVFPANRFWAGVRSAASPAAVLLFFALLTTYLTWPLSLRMATGLSDAPDVLLNYWTLSWDFHTLPRAPLSLFDANIFFPHKDTLAYSEHLVGVALAAAPAFWLTGSSLVAYNFAVFASFVLSGLGMYALVRELAGSRYAGLFAGVAYASVSYRFHHLLHIQLLSYQWFPWAFLYLIRFARDGRPRQLVAASSFTLLQILSCNYYALYLALAFAWFAVVGALYGRRALTARKILALLLAAALTALAALPFFLPYQRNRSEQGFYRRYEDVVHFSATPSDYLRPSSFSKAPYVGLLSSPGPSEKTLFPGFAVLVLALGGWIHGRGGRPEEAGPLPVRRMAVVASAGLVVLGFVLSLGPQIELGDRVVTLPYRFFYRYVPGFYGLRVPARLAVLAFLGLSILSGMGLASLLRRLPSARHAIGIGMVALAIWEYSTTPPDRLFPQAPEAPPVYRWLASQPGEFGVLEIPLHEDITKEALRMVHSTVHWKRLANGFSGWWPNEYWVLVGRMRHFPTQRILTFLEREVPVRYIVIHYDEFPERAREQLARNMSRYGERLPLRARFGSDAVHEFLRAEPPPQ